MNPGPANHKSPIPEGYNPKYHGLKVTREEYLELEEDGYLYDMIQGVLYMTPSGTFEHSAGFSNFLVLLGNYLKQNPIGRAVCEVDVLLPDGLDLLRPDVTCVLDDGSAKVDKYVYGAPDLVAESLSDSATGALQAAGLLPREAPSAPQAHSRPQAYSPHEAPSAPQAHFRPQAYSPREAPSAPQAPSRPQAYSPREAPSAPQAHSRPQAYSRAKRPPRRRRTPGRRPTPARSALRAAGALQAAGLHRAKRPPGRRPTPPRTAPAPL